MHKLLSRKYYECKLSHLCKASKLLTSSVSNLMTSYFSLSKLEKLQICIRINAQTAFPLIADSYQHQPMKNIITADSNAPSCWETVSLFSLFYHGRETELSCSGHIVFAQIFFKSMLSVARQKHAFRRLCTKSTHQPASLLSGTFADLPPSCSKQLRRHRAYLCHVLVFATHGALPLPIRRCTLVQKKLITALRVNWGHGSESPMCNFQVWTFRSRASRKSLRWESSNSNEVAAEVDSNVN